MRSLQNPNQFALVTLTAAILLLVCLPGPATGSVWESEDVLEISRLHTIDDDLWAFSEDFTLNGSVTGDVMSFAYEAEINGKINGSLQSFSRHFRMSGSIDGSARMFSQTITVSGYVGRSIVAGGEKFYLDRGAVIGRDVRIWGSDITIDGTIRNNADLEAERVEIKGTIEGNVTVTANRLIVMPPAVIQGDLTYITTDTSDVDIAPGVTVLGETTWRTPKVSEEEDDSSPLTESLLRIASLLAAFLFGIIVVRIFRPYAEESFKQLRHRIGVSIATGFLGVFALIFCTLILFIAVISILAGIVLVGSGGLAIFGAPLLVVSILLVPITSFLSVSGAVVFYSGKIIVAFVLGSLLVKPRDGIGALRASALLLGLAVLGLAFAIPYLGFLVYLGVSIVGAGAIILGIRHCPRTHDSSSDDSSSSRPGPQPAADQ
ncbi:hypothetical protein GF420_08475 [candidate division GN15 bacterium]|nr:hypothetical protein [candidate division GN15 bacterium]